MLPFMEIMEHVTHSSLFVCLSRVSYCMLTVATAYFRSVYGLNMDELNIWTIFGYEDDALKSFDDIQ